jgi:heme/copper-type cytochrome/quinol oxidase subunit 3
LSNILILTHPAFGILSVLAAVWLLVETMNANGLNQARITKAAYGVTIFMLLAWIFGGVWYVEYYPMEKAMILNGPWAFAHSFYMEVKEHLFFIPLILALYLPVVVTRNRLHANRTARIMVVAICVNIIILSLSIEVAGAVINQGSKVSFVQKDSLGDKQ